MVVPLAARCVAAVLGAALVFVAWASVIGTLIVSRPVRNRLTRWVQWVVLTAYRLATWNITDYRRRDRVLATQAAAILLSQLVAWMVMVFVGFALLLWPFAGAGIASAFSYAGSSLFTLGYKEPAGSWPGVFVFAAAASGLVIVALQVGYLPTLYSAFNRRETEVALLNARSGVPSWGPELLARTHYALGSGTSTVDTLPDLYSRWERWAADVAESHTTYLSLVWFRSPRPLSSWVTALLAVLDSAALYLALSPEAAPTVPARLCLRGGFDCLTRVAQAMGCDVPEIPDSAVGISVTYAEFLDAVERMREVNFDIEREPADAWPHFVGWRINYEQAAYAIADAIDAVPALWSGTRQRPSAPIPPFRPPRLASAGCSSLFELAGLVVTGWLLDDDVQAVVGVDEGDDGDQGGELVLVVVLDGVRPGLVRDAAGRVGDAGALLRKLQRSALGIGEDCGLSPGRDQVEAHRGLPGAYGFLGVHVDAESAAVDLAGADLHQFLRRGGQRRACDRLARRVDVLEELGCGRAAEEVETSIHGGLLFRCWWIYLSDATARPDVTGTDVTCVSMPPRASQGPGGMTNL
jgi:hypothetical protein